METLLLLTPANHAQFKAEHFEMDLRGFNPPESYPALLVYHEVDAGDDNHYDYILYYKYVYPTDFPEGA